MIYDTLICGAQIIDGTNIPPFTAHVAIHAGKIKFFSVDEKLLAKNIIDATGLYLAPGFIDVHTHDDTNVINSPAMLPKISQGITTVIVGNCGISAATAHLTTAPPNPMNLLGTQADFRYAQFNDYAHAVKTAQPSVNVGALVGHTTLRNNVMDDLQRPATDTEILAMRKQLRAALQQGALGLSSGLAYDSAMQAPTSEIMALVEELAAVQGVYTSHLRTEFDEILTAMDEAFATAKHAQVPLIVSHLKCAGAGNWGRSKELLTHIEQAATNQKIACDCYPYSASSSTLDLQQVTDKNPIFITWSDAHPNMSGKFLHAIAEEWSVSLHQAAEHLIPAGAVYHCMHEDDVQTILRYQRTMIGSDGLPNDPHPHPRLWGAFPRVIGHYCRDLGLFPLATAIHKMTGLSAAEFRLNKRGTISEGHHADLVLFNFERIHDCATFENPKQMASGIEKVWVNGILSYDNGRALNAGAGVFLYRTDKPSTIAP
jgi:N-acyl-D-aspartate/D-glutamate deacylase